MAAAPTLAESNDTATETTGTSGIVLGGSGSSPSGSIDLAGATSNPESSSSSGASGSIEIPAVGALDDYLGLSPVDVTKATMLLTRNDGGGASASAGLSSTVQGAMTTLEQVTSNALGTSSASSEGALSLHGLLR